MLPKPENVRGNWLNFKCPICGEGSRNKAPFGVNIETGQYGCFRCGVYRTVEDPESLKALLAGLTPVKTYAKSGDSTAPGDVPDYLHRVLYDRGVDPVETVAEYGLRWDGSRLCWPVGDLFWRRAVHGGQSPKVLFDPGPKGLLGAHRLRPGCHIVIAEGDYKAASIPRPWIGVAIGGVFLSGGQRDAILRSAPATVTVWLDGEMRQNVGAIIASLAHYVSVRRAQVDLPERVGPDDIPMRERMSVLLETWKE